MDLKLRDRVVMVAAASRGLGYATALACAREGASVSIASRDAQSIDAAADAIRLESGARVHAQTFDARDGESISAWARATEAALGPVDGMVINAGGPPPGGFEAFSDEDWQAAFELTLLSAVRMARAVVPGMKARGRGAIITITSSSVKEPIDVLLLSGVMRSGVTSLVKSLSHELAPHGVRVNNLMPGIIDTDRVAALDEAHANRQGVSAEEARSHREGSLPMARYGTPDEFGRVAAFLLSDAASYVSGATLAVDGGKMTTVW